MKDTDTKELRCFIDQIRYTLIYLDVAGWKSDQENFEIITQLVVQLTGELQKQYEHQLHNVRPEIKWFHTELKDCECQFHLQPLGLV